jgi:hypothetical protein
MSQKAFMNFKAWIEKPTVRFAQIFRTKKMEETEIGKGYTLPHFLQITSIQHPFV